MNNYKSIPIEEIKKYSYDNTKKQINNIITVYKKGLYSTSIVMDLINKACSMYCEIDKKYSFDEIISKRNKLFLYGLSQMKKAIIYIERIN